MRDEREGDAGEHLLHRLVEPRPAEARAQDGVTLRDPHPGAAQRVVVDLLAEGHDHLLDVDAGVRPVTEPVEEHAVLHRREPIGRFDGFHVPSSGAPGAARRGHARRMSRKDDEQYRHAAAVPDESLLMRRPEARRRMSCAACHTAWQFSADMVDEAGKLVGERMALGSRPPRRPTACSGGSKALCGACSANHLSSRKCK